LIQPLRKRRSSGVLAKSGFFGKGQPAERHAGVFGAG
jgi:hypothetical protein